MSSVCQHAGHLRPSGRCATPGGKPLIFSPKRSASFIASVIASASSHREVPALDLRDLILGMAKSGGGNACANLEPAMVAKRTLENRPLCSPPDRAGKNCEQSHKTQCTHSGLVEICTQTHVHTQALMKIANVLSNSGGAL